MAKKMLIDATHTEETRVVVVDGTKVEEFDFESDAKRQLAGNIYLAKVTRVEPSLQAAFVEYGGNRHGFLAFSEIHPDYYQIPVADREALMEEERAYAEAQKARDDEDDKPKPKARSWSRNRSRSKAAAVKSEDAVATSEVPSTTINGMETIDLDTGEHSVSELGQKETSEHPEYHGPFDAKTTRVADDAPQISEQTVAEQDGEKAPDDEAAQASDEKGVVQTEDVSGENTPAAATDDIKAAPSQDASETDETDVTEAQVSATQEGEPVSSRAADATAKDETIESIADEDDEEDIRPLRKPRARRYKIQEVVKVRQILLVQVVKEERGNKGAALTTYLSLAGRYCVLMPNTARGGGISRKITNAVDRKKLKEIAGEIEIPQGAGLIVRTAGAKRTKTEIKRDYEYLQRLWEQIRELTLKSIAPAKIYEEGDLIKRSIRDLYNREIDEVLVEGERGYRIAKDFMKMIMPSHAKNVKNYQDTLPLFARFQVESYLNSMFNPVVQLKSGGYIVIGVTEALVAVDVNSGRATKEGSIEDTALKTNLEAAEEVARQVRLRDLAGLIVIDFIDMDERKNNLSVEKRIKDKLKTDRARIQVGRISGFGLMEMSRQRLRPGMIEATTQGCPHCHGTGLIRSDDNLALAILRQIEEEGVRRRSREVVVTCPVGIANFLMNQKREHIGQIEARYGLAVRVEGDAALVSPDFSIEKLKTATRVISEPSAAVVSVDSTILDEIDAESESVEKEAQDTAENETVDTVAGEDQKPKKRRRRRRRRKSNGADNDEAGQSEAAASGDISNSPAPQSTSETEQLAPENAEVSVVSVKSSDNDAANVAQDGRSSVALNETPDGGLSNQGTDETTITGDSAGEVQPSVEHEAPKKTARRKTATPRKRASKKIAKEETAAESGGLADGETPTSDASATEPEVEIAAQAAAPEAVKKPRRRRKKAEPVAVAEVAPDVTPQATLPQATLPQATLPEISAPISEGATPVSEGSVETLVGHPDPAPQPEQPITSPPVDVPPVDAPALSEPEVTAKPAKPEVATKPKRRGWWSLGK
ncbi:Rne/Rng family ribonuclease [Rhodobacteraceae bacterium]|nr:Rne/Rng family ribonuclease [Paracoccaceae bacterium]